MKKILFTILLTFIFLNVFSQTKNESDEIMIQLYYNVISKQADSTISKQILLDVSESLYYKVKKITIEPKVIKPIETYLFKLNGNYIDLKKIDSKLIINRGIFFVRYNNGLSTIISN